MRKIFGVLVVSLISGVASADLAIELKNNSQYVTEPESAGATYVDQVLVQLIWTASIPTTQAGIGGTLGAEEFLLNSLVTTSGYRGTFSDQPQGVLQYDDGDVGGSSGSDTAILDGYFFVRMFDNTATGLGDFYLQQSQQGTPLTKYDAQLTDTIYSTDTLIGGSDLDAQGNQVIPEPAVAALLGIFGGGLLVARRLFPGQS